MKSDQTIIRKNHMEPLHFITNLLDIKDPNIKSVDIINMDPPEGNHWRNMIFKNRLRFHTLKRLACLPKLSLKSASLSTIIAQKLVERTSMTDIATSFPFQLQPSFGSSMTFTLNMTLADFLRLCPGTLKQSGEWLFQSGDEDEFHCARFWQAQYHRCPWRQDTNYHPKSLSALRSSCSLSGENHYDGYV